MNRIRALLLLALGTTGSLLLVACRSTGTPSSTPVYTSTPTPPTPKPTATPSPEPPPVYTSTPTSSPDPTATPPAPSGGAANADVTHVRAIETGSNTWTFHVTVEHPDTGWEDYADGWDVVTPDGTVLKPDPESPFTRLLLHPHVGEQPFTRSQSGIAIPEGVTQVRVRAHDLVDGFGGREVLVDLTATSGDDYVVERK